MKSLEMTEMELLVVESIKKMDGLDECYCGHPEDISDSTKISMNKLRGVVSSLCKKNICYMDELVSGCGKWVILFEGKNEL